MGKSSEESGNAPPQENASGQAQKDANLYENRAETKKIIRVVTVVAYVFSVSFAAILLSVYYVFLWEPPNPRMIQRSRLIGEPQAEYLTDRLHQRTPGSSSHPEKSATLQDIEINPDYSKTDQARQLVYLSMIPAPTPVLSSPETSKQYPNSARPLKLAPGSFDLNSTPPSTAASTTLTKVPDYLLKFVVGSTSASAGESRNLEAASSAAPAILSTEKDRIGAVEKIKSLQLLRRSRQNGQRVTTTTSLWNNPEVSTEGNNDDDKHQLGKNSNNFHLKSWTRYNEGGVREPTSASKFHRLSSPGVDEDSLAETTATVLGVSPTSDNQVAIGAGVTTEESRTQTATPAADLHLYDNLNSSSITSLRNNPYDSGSQPEKENSEAEEGRGEVEKGAVEKKEQADQRYRGSPTPSFEERIHYADENARDILKNRK
ncbi:uncharacterized protein LOC105691826 [Athalia rosae]|uniref:uncharacterized protein LOC105691826 n=1 Tax=Athalia rosae TaxID=37344 RepID=UPI002033482F|nr:uncharacterized protein LOC105691826 [Athalia rosae]